MYKRVTVCGEWSSSAFGLIRLLVPLTSTERTAAPGSPAPEEGRGPRGRGQALCLSDRLHAGTWRQLGSTFLQRYIFKQPFGSFRKLWEGAWRPSVRALPRLLQLLPQPGRQGLPEFVQQLGELHVVVSVVAGQEGSAIRVHWGVFPSFALSKAFCFTFFQ